MRGYRSLALLGLALLLASAAFAQTPEEDFAATLDLLLSSAGDGDAEAAGGLLYETFIMVEMDGGLVTREEALQGIAAGEVPGNLALTECEPKVYGDLAYAIAPVNIELGEGAVDGTPTLFAVGIMTDDGWQLINVTLALVWADPENVPGDAAQGAMEKLWARFDQFERIGETGDTKAFFDMCNPEGLMAGPYGPEGSMAVARVADIAAMADMAPEMTMSPADEEDIEVAAGIGSCIVAVSMNVTMGGETALTRQIAILAWDGDAEDWMVVVAAEAPVE